MFPDVWLDLSQSRRLLIQLCWYWTLVSNGEKIAGRSQPFDSNFKRKSYKDLNRLSGTNYYLFVRNKIILHPNISFSWFQGIYTNINRILSEAGELIKGGHYAAAHVRGVAARLDKAWKEFAGGLDERTTVLALSVMFHQKAERVWMI